MNDNLSVIETALDKAQQLIITQSTPSEEIRKRIGRGGKQLSYVDHAYVTRLLNNAFAFNWDFETDQAEVLYIGDRPYEVKCRGKLTVRVGDMAIVKMQYGCQPLEFMKNDQDKPVSLGDAFKGAASDALKKCASLLGIALDLYDSDSDLNTGKKPSPQVNPVTPVSDRGQVVEPAHQAEDKALPVPPGEMKSTNGGKKEIDPMTRFWLEVKAAGMERQKGLDILASCDNNPSRAVDVLLGIAQDAVTA